MDQRSWRQGAAIVHSEARGLERDGRVAGDRRPADDLPDESTGRHPRGERVQPHSDRRRHAIGSKVDGGRDGCPLLLRVVPGVEAQGALIDAVEFAVVVGERQRHRAAERVGGQQAVEVADAVARFAGNGAIAVAPVWRGGARRRTGLHRERDDVE